MATAMARTMGTGLVCFCLAVAVFSAYAAGLSDVQGRLKAAAQRRALLNEERRARIHVMKKPALSFRPPPTEMDAEEVLETEEEHDRLPLFAKLRFSNLRREISDAAHHAEHNVPGAGSDRLKLEAQKKLEDRRMKRLIKEVLREFDAEKEVKTQQHQVRENPEVSATKQKLVRKLKKSAQAHPASEVRAPESAPEMPAPPAEDSNGDQAGDELTERMAKASELRQKLKQRLNQQAAADADDKVRKFCISPYWRHSSAHCSWAPATTPF